jgi:hypothetical protein
MSNPEIIEWDEYGQGYGADGHLLVCICGAEFLDWSKHYCVYDEEPDEFARHLSGYNLDMTAAPQVDPNPPAPDAPAPAPDQAPAPDNPQPQSPPPAPAPAAPVTGPAAPQTVPPAPSQP